MQRVELARMAGTSALTGKVTGASVGVGTFGVGVGANRGNISGTQQTALAKSLEPPTSFIGRLIVFFLIVGGLVAFGAFLYINDTVALIALVGIPTILTTLLLRSNFGKDEVKAQGARLADWKSTYICHRCGTKFVYRD